MKSLFPHPKGGRKWNCISRENPMVPRLLTPALLCSCEWNWTKKKNLCERQSQGQEEHPPLYGHCRRKEGISRKGTQELWIWEHDGGKGVRDCSAALSPGGKRGNSEIRLITSGLKRCNRGRDCTGPHPLPVARDGPRAKPPEYEGVEDRHSLRFSVAVLAFHSK